MRRFFLTLILCLFSLSCFATHNRGGEITYRHVAGYTYEVTVTTITYSESAADRCQLEINWGDGTYGTIDRANGEYGLSPSGYYCLTGEMLEGYNDVRMNKYVATHTYSGNGTFLISVEDPNRNYGVMNIPNSVNVPFYLETSLVIDNFMGVNNSPQTTMYPVDVACVGKLFVANSGAYDIDGDSLSYELVQCKGVGGADIPGYSFPAASNALYLDSISGNFVWDTPVMQGEFNFAYRIYEWRKGVCIGYVTRDFQVIVTACDNEPPTLSVVGEECVVAGDTLKLIVEVADVDEDMMMLLAAGEIFAEDYGATFVIEENLPGKTVGIVTWPTDCDDISARPYALHFRATEQDNRVNLSNFLYFNVNVIGDKPQWVDIEPVTGNIALYWEKYYCDDFDGYFIYRTDREDNFVQGDCEIGMPENIGYENIKTIYAETDAKVMSFVDDGGELGLSPGIMYSYRIVAFCGDAEKPEICSKVSDKISAKLRRDVSVITKVSVNETSKDAGVVEVVVSPPTEIDILQYPGPYRYDLFMSNHNGGYSMVYSTKDIFNDTIVVNEGLNTVDNQYFYYVEMFDESSEVPFYIGKSKVATSLFLTVESKDRSALLKWNCLVPWNVDYYRIYDVDGVVVMDYVEGNECLVEQLTNGIEYTFRVESVGRFYEAGYLEPVLNFSQYVSVTPEDVEPPCAPVLYLDVDCDEMVNNLFWTNPNNVCCDDVDRYYIYYQQKSSGEYIVLDSVFFAADTSYIHYNDNKLAGCYYIVAADVNDNYSEPSNVECAYGDECPNYVLPNVFTPNGDGYNDIFSPITFSSVERVEMTIYNRHGREVFETTDPNIMWDGKDMFSGNAVSDGVYFYVCVVHSYSYDGEYQTILNGVVHVLR